MLFLKLFRRKLYKKTMMAENCIANGTISIILPNLEAFYDDEGKPKPIASSVEKIGGLPWQMEIHRMLKTDKLVLYIHCNEDVKDHLWLCKAKFALQTGLLDGTGQRIHTKNRCFFFTFDTCCFFLSQTIFNQLKTSPVEFKLDVHVSHAVLTNLPELDTTLVVKMGEDDSETLLVNKHVLAGMSPYFNNLFFGEWSEKKKDGDGDQFILNEPSDFDIEAFTWMLYGAMTQGWVVQEPNFFNSNKSVRIIRLAVKFEMALMVHYCEKSLIRAKMTTNCQHSKMELLELADQFSLDQLKEHCLDEIGMPDFMENFAKITEIHSRLSKDTKERLQAIFDGKAKKLRASTNALEANIRGDGRYRGLVDPFKELAKAIWGQKASTIEAAESGSEEDSFWDDSD